MIKEKCKIKAFLHNSRMEIAEFIDEWWHTGDIKYDIKDKSMTVSRYQTSPFGGFQSEWGGLK